MNRLVAIAVVTNQLVFGNNRVVIPDDEIRAGCELVGTPAVSILACPDKMIQASECITLNHGLYFAYSTEFITDASSSFEDITCEISGIVETCKNDQAVVQGMKFDPQHYTITKPSKETMYEDALFVVETQLLPIRNTASTVVVFEQSIRRFWHDKVTGVMEMQVFTYADNLSYIADMELLDDIAVILEQDQYPECPAPPGGSPKVTDQGGNAIRILELDPEVTSYTGEDTITILDVDTADFSKILRFGLIKGEEEGTYSGMVGVENPDGTVEVLHYMVATEGDDAGVPVLQEKENMIKFIASQDIQLTTFVYQENLLIVGCSTCYNGRGWISFYDSLTFEQQYEILGSDDRKEVGKSIHVQKDSLNYLRIYWSSYDPSMETQAVNVLVIPQTAMGTYSFAELERLYVTDIAVVPVIISGDDPLTFTSSGQDLAYKLESSLEVTVIKSCDLTSFYNADQQTCIPCPETAPYSGGIQSGKCFTCDELLNINEIAHFELNCSGDKREYKVLRPLDEKEFDPTPYYIFAMITAPIMTIYCCITCYCKNQRTKRKEMEKKLRAKKYEMKTTKTHTASEAELRTKEKESAGSSQESKSKVIGFLIEEQKPDKKDAIDTALQHGIRQTSIMDTELALPTERALITDQDEPVMDFALIKEEGEMPRAKMAPETPMY